LVARCAALGIAVDEAMLSWERGVHPSDGVWAAHWYDRFIDSTGFAPYRARAIALDDALESVAAACRPYYDTLFERRLVVA
jgi:hypothetical protein